MSARVLLIDNYDSFTYNLVQALRVLDAEVLVHRNDRIDQQQAERLDPTHLVISPGPGRPEDSRASLQMIEAFSDRIPVLGVCLGHQALATVSGGVVRRADRVMHGKSSLVYHDDKTIYKGLPNPFQTGRYHSLCVEPLTLPDHIKVTAYTSEGEVMGLRRADCQSEGVQFHPESILTPEGPRLLRNFLGLSACDSPVASQSPEGRTP